WQIGGTPGAAWVRLHKAQSPHRECRWLRYNDSFGGGPGGALGWGPAMGTLAKIIGVGGVHKDLAHRLSFLLVAGVLDMERLTRLVGLKKFSSTEAHFQGHFPGKPVMPGVLIIEAMAQTGGLLLLLEVPDRENKLLFFAAVDGARFRRPVVPGDQLK